jgi:hypothetical protein
MKKLVGIIAVIVAGFGLTFLQEKKPRQMMPTEDSTATAEIARQDAAYDQSRKTFDALSQKMADKRRQLMVLQDLSDDAKDVYAKLEEIQKEKIQILHAKPIQDGHVQLSDDEMEKIAELDRQELEKQQRLLQYINTLKDL